MPASFTRHELAGAFGDLGTDLPLLVGVVLATAMNPTTAFVPHGYAVALVGGTLPSRFLRRAATRPAFQT